MWGTGIVFFFITYAESHLYPIPYFRENMVREIMVQWKSYGSLTGSWNMLVYSTHITVAFTVSGVAMMIGFWIILWHGFRLVGLIITPGAVGVAERGPA